jgi:arylsulfatase A-like enzyme/Flp pilus assembly protein TadD
VSVDTLRADYLSCYGSTRAPTPGFDRIAREGVLFENATTVAPMTLPAHASLLTGVSPLAHSVHDNVGFRLRDDIPTLATLLKANGYRTGGFVGSFVLDERFGLARGFDVYSDQMPQTERLGLPERQGGAVLEEATRWIEGSPDEPFFAFLHFFDPHRPYDPPEEFEPGVQDPLARYLGEVRYVDSLLGKLLQFLEAKRLLDSTVVVVTADHGESLGEHQEDTHGFFLYESTLSVPLLMRGPSIPKGERARPLIRILDVAPTLLEILGIEAPGGLEGVSFLTREGVLRAPEVESYAETFLPRLHFGWSELRSLRRGNSKFILAPASELYDLDSDAEETRNVAGEKASLARELRSKLEAMRDTSGAVRAGKVDDRTLASLRALGYLGGSSTTPAEGPLADPKDRVAIYKEILELSVVAAPTAEDVKRIEAVLDQEPRNPRALAIYGGFLLSTERPGDAEAVYRRLLGVQVDSFDGHFGLGRALLALQKNDEGRSSLLKALELDPTSASVHSTLASLERAAGNREASERHLRGALASEPSLAGYRELADSLLSQGREAELSQMADSWQGPGADAAKAYARGQILESQGNVEGAILELERAHAAAPSDDNVEQALANALSRASRFEEAIAHYQAILARSPCYLGALTNLGAAYERRGNPDEGIRAYRSAIECDPGYASAYRNLGAAFARKGNLRDALDALRNAKRLAPEDPELDAAIAELESLTR